MKFFLLDIIINIIILLKSSLPNQVIQLSSYGQAKLLYDKCSKILNIFFLFSNKTLVLGLHGIHKMFSRIANREEPDQTASDLDLHCLSMLF